MVAAMDHATQTVSEPARPRHRGVGRPFGGVAAGVVMGHGDTSGPWHDDLLGNVWSWPPEDEIDESATIAEIEALLGELVAELEG